MNNPIMEVVLLRGILSLFNAAIFITTMLVAISIVYSIRFWANNKRMLDIPNTRSSHKIPTPRGGGLSIVIVTLGVALLYQLYTGNASWVTVLTYVFSSAIIAVLGWTDDVHNLSAKQRFAVQIGCAVLAITVLGYWQSIELPLIGTLQLGIIGLPITVLWIVGLTNAYNFMDGIDGLAGSTALIAGLAWAQLNSFSGLVGLIGLAVAGSSLGFLRHNWSPAKIFMGDVGSTFLGFTFAVLPLMVEQRSSSAVLGVLVVWPFIFDAGFTILRRLKQGENIFAAHRSHLYQRLIIAGYPHALITSIYAILALIGWLVAVAWLNSPFDGALHVWILPLTLFVLIWGFVNYIESVRKSEKV
jgi:Fuc2NAc and GlcNAc transferase